MKLKILLLSVFFSFFLKSSFSQIDYTMFAGVDYGSSYFGNRMADNINFIRNNVSEYSIYNSSQSNSNSSIISNFDAKHFSASTEFMFFDNFLGIGGGIRYSKYSCSLGDQDNDSKYYYLKFSETATNTKYLKIYSINQTIHNIGIPIEIRFIPNREANLRLYFKLSYEINLNVNSKMDVNFVNESMSIYEQEIKNLFEKSSTYSGIFTPAIGMKFWNEENSPEIGFEIGCSYFTNSKVSSLIKELPGFSMQFNIQMPLNLN